MQIEANPEVFYTLEGFFPDRQKWLPIQSNLKDEVVIAELLDQLKIDVKCPRNPATAYRMVKVTRDTVGFLEIPK